jgi:hypothetical protein
MLHLAECPLNDQLAIEVFGHAAPNLVLAIMNSVHGFYD